MAGRRCLPGATGWPRIAQKLHAAFLAGDPSGFSAGLTSSFLAGAGAGAVVGGGIGALVGAGISEERIKEYESGLKEGGILTGVKPRNPEERAYLEQDWSRGGRTTAPTARRGA